MLLIATCSLIFGVSFGHTRDISKIVPIAPEGRTVLQTKSNNVDVQITILTHSVAIGTVSDTDVKNTAKSCTYSRYPCSIVDKIDITVNGISVKVPFNSFCGLADLKDGHISFGKDYLSLLLTGGDASEGYSARIEFDKERVKHITIWSEDEKKPLQEIIYHRVVTD